MERIIFLCLSTFQCHSSLFTENRAGPSNRCTTSSNLADPTLVHCFPAFASRLPCPSSTVTLPTDTTSQSCVASPLGTDETNGLQALWKSLQQRNVSDTAAQIILKSWSTGTQKQYKSYINGLVFVTNGRVIPTTHLWQQFWIFLSASTTRDCHTPPWILPGVPYQPLLYQWTIWSLALIHSFPGSWKVYKRVPANSSIPVNLGCATCFNLYFLC